MSSTAVVCDQCGEGNLVWRADRQWFTCSVCEAEIAWEDIGYTGFVFQGVVHVQDEVK